MNNYNNNSKNIVKKVTEQERLKMIAEKAYTMAEDRGFTDDWPLTDWKNAEIEVDKLLNSGK